MGNCKDIILVCEDTAHQSFVRMCLTQFNVKNLNWHLEGYVASRQRRQDGNRDEAMSRLSTVEFPAWQKRLGRHKTLLIAVLDADDESQDELRRKLPVDSSPLYVVVIPKRNIQTWVQLADVVDGNDQNWPDETIDYKKTSNQSDKRAREAAEVLMKKFNRCDQEPENDNEVWKIFKEQMKVLKKGLDVLGLSV